MSKPATAPAGALDMRSATVKRRARGYEIGGGRRRIALTLYDDLFETIEQRAAAAKVSFNEEANTLLEWAVEAYERFERESQEGVA